MERFVAVLGNLVSGVLNDVIRVIGSTASAVSGDQVNTEFFSLQEVPSQLGLQLKERIGRRGIASKYARMTILEVAKDSEETTAFFDQKIKQLHCLCERGFDNWQAQHQEIQVPRAARTVAVRELSW